MPTKLQKVTLEASGLDLSLVGGNLLKHVDRENGTAEFPFDKLPDVVARLMKIKIENPSGTVRLEF